MLKTACIHTSYKVNPLDAIGLYIYMPNVYFLCVQTAYIYWASLIARLEYGTVEWKMEWNSDHTQL